jgi:hypothetical protein
MEDFVYERQQQFFAGFSLNIIWWTGWLTHSTSFLVLAIARRCNIFGWPSSTFSKRLMKDKRTTVKILICWCADPGEHGIEMNDLFVCRPLRTHTWNEEIVDVQTLKITDLKLLICWCADRFNTWLVCRPWRTPIWNYWLVVCRPWRTHIWNYLLAGDVQTLKNTDIKLLIGWWCADPGEHRLYWCAAPVPAADAHCVPGLLTLYLLQLSR